MMSPEHAEIRAKLARLQTICIGESRLLPGGRSVAPEKLTEHAAERDVAIACLEEQMAKLESARQGLRLQEKWKQENDWRQNSMTLREYKEQVGRLLITVKNLAMWLIQEEELIKLLVAEFK